MPRCVRGVTAPAPAGSDALVFPSPGHLEAPVVSSAATLHGGPARGQGRDAQLCKRSQHPRAGKAEAGWKEALARGLHSLPQRRGSCNPWRTGKPGLAGPVGRGEDRHTDRDRPATLPADTLIKTQEYPPSSSGRESQGRGRRPPAECIQHRSLTASQKPWHGGGVTGTEALHPGTRSKQRNHSK